MTSIETHAPKVRKSKREIKTCPKCQQHFEGTPKQAFCSFICKKPQPKYKIGDKVKSKYSVYVRKQLPRGGKYLELLPGTIWTVIDVDNGGSGAPTYELICERFKIRRKEYRIVRANKG